jgi:hypothetical protein
MKYAKSTNKQRRERGDWPHNERMVWESQQAWMEERKNPLNGVISIIPRYSPGKTYVKEKQGA